MPYLLVNSRIGRRCHSVPFGPGLVSGPKAVEAHVKHLETYDLDFLKIMDDNRYSRIGLPSGMIAARTRTWIGSAS